MDSTVSIVNIFFGRKELRVDEQCGSAGRQLNGGKKRNGRSLRGKISKTYKQFLLKQERAITRNGIKIVLEGDNAPL